MTETRQFVSDPLTQELRHLEEELTDAYVRKSPSDLAHLLADEFREFGSSGRVFDKAQILRELATQPDFRIRIEDFQARALGPDLALATYRAEVCRPGSTKLSRSLRSSLWRKNSDRWVVIFHQGTRVDADPAT